ncbi:MAG: ABC transporter substrate-binding protein [Halofilum sp. (in: g-proteobacteria)]|nr:ABC transporter substrate-binding protein [Halofilum sp. (in: g-proteobacteria)]
MTDRNDGPDDKPKQPGFSRRNFLKTTGASAVIAGTAPSFFVRDAWAQDALGNFPVKGKTVTLGFNVPQTGSYADEGADELRAYKLAVQHINNGGGMLETLSPLSLTGQGVLGKKVDYVTGDTQTDPDAARTSARRMIERDKVIMFTGGSSSATAIAQQYLAQELSVQFMCGLTHSNDTTGKDRRRYGFRHFFNAYMTGKALAPVLAKDYGSDRRAFHLTADYTWGHTQYQSMKEFTEAEGWTTVNNIMTPLGSSDFSQFLTAALNSDADVLVLNHYGQDAGQLADPGRAVRHEGDGEERQADADRGAALQPPDGAGRRRPQHRRRLRHDGLELDPRRRWLRRLHPDLRDRVRLRRRRRPRTPATCRRCSTPTPASAPVPSIRRRSSRPSRTTSSTAVVPARPSTARATTSASRTCWWCRARARTRSRASTTCSIRSRRCRATAWSTPRTTSRVSWAPTSRPDTLAIRQRPRPRGRCPRQPTVARAPAALRGPMP